LMAQSAGRMARMYGVPSPGESPGAETLVVSWIS
jgi:hypothetical protein